MKVENLERVALNVPNLEESIDMFKSFLGIDFEKKVELKQPDGKEIRAAISSKGLELLEETPPLKEMSVRSFHFKVKDLDEAQEWAEKNGGTILGRFSIGDVQQVICKFMDLRIILISYPGADVIKAMGPVVG